MEAAILEQYTAENNSRGVKESVITLKITISNTGAMPSAATSWMLFVEVVGRNPRLCYIYHFGNEMTLGFSNGIKDIIKSQYMIYEKTANPIQAGAIVVGYLHFRTFLCLKFARQTR